MGRSLVSISYNVLNEAHPHLQLCMEPPESILRLKCFMICSFVPDAYGDHFRCLSSSVLIFYLRGLIVIHPYLIQCSLDVLAETDEVPGNPTCIVILEEMMNS